MASSTIFRTEPMATRALAAEIRHDSERFVRLLESVGEAGSLGVLQSLSCEAVEQVDLQLDFADCVVGIEAKLDHELTPEQISREAGVVDRLFVLLPRKESAPDWLAREHPEVGVLSWEEALACFTGSRLTLEDIHADRLLKSTVEAWLAELRLEERMPGWDVEIRRGGSGMPSIIIESPELPCGRTLRGQVEVYGRRMPEVLEEVRFTRHTGVSVPEDAENYFDPEDSDVIPGWISHLRTLQTEVLEGQERRLRVSRHAPGESRRELGRWKLPLARRHLGAHTHLAKGYTDGWALGPKSTPVGRDRLAELADSTVEIFTRWFAAETSH